MDWMQVDVFTATPGVEPVCAAMEALGVTGFSIRDAADFEAFLQGKQGRWDYIDDRLMNLREAESTVTFYLDTGEQGKARLEQAKQALARLRALDEESAWGRLELAVEMVSDENWENNWKQYWHPTPIGERLVVCPTWEEFSPAPGQVVLRLDPGAAFGSGTHDSTRLCLELLQQVQKGGETVLDLGCGSGILAVAALLMGAQSARGTDIDAVAVGVARENAALNGVGDRAEFAVGDLAKGIAGPFDLVFANIVADIILRLAPDLPRLLAPGGRLITSGIIDTRGKEVENALGAAGLEVQCRRESGGWVALLAAQPQERL